MGGTEPEGANRIYWCSYCGLINEEHLVSGGVLTCATTRRVFLGRDPQEKELEALNGDKFHLSRVSRKNFGDFTRLDTGTSRVWVSCQDDHVP